MYIHLLFIIRFGMLFLLLCFFKWNQMKLQNLFQKIHKNNSEAMLETTILIFKNLDLTFLPC